MYIKLTDETPDVPDVGFHGANGKVDIPDAPYAIAQSPDGFLLTYQVDTDTYRLMTMEDLIDMAEQAYRYQRMFDLVRQLGGYYSLRVAAKAGEGSA